MPKYFFMRENLRIQCMAWPLYCTIVLIINNQIRPYITFGDECIALILLILIFNACMLIFYAMVLKKWIWKSVALVILLFILLAELIGQLELFGVRIYNAQEATYYWTMLSKYIGVWIMAAGLVFHIKSQLNVKLKQQETELRHQKEMEAKEMEFAFRTVQLNPHFLFNVLSTIQGKTIQLLPEVAHDMEQLAQLLRYLLESSDQVKKKVLLINEMEALEQYIQLEKSRFDHVYMQYRVVGEPTFHKVGPGLLITLVENAFKYGLYTDHDKPIIISLCIDEDKIVFECSNWIDIAKKKSASLGIGLKNLQERLEFAFSNGFKYDTSIKDNRYNVRLLINQD